MSVMGLTANAKVEGINKDVEWDDKLPQELKDYISKTYPNGESDAVEYFTKIYYSVYVEDNLNSPIEIDYDGDGIPESCRVSYLSTRKEDMKWVDSSFGSDGKHRKIKSILFLLILVSHLIPVKIYSQNFRSTDRSP